MKKFLAAKSVSLRDCQICITKEISTITYFYVRWLIYSYCSEGFWDHQLTDICSWIFNFMLQRVRNHKNRIHNIFLKNLGYFFIPGTNIRQCFVHLQPKFDIFSELFIFKAKIYALKHWKHPVLNFWVLLPTGWWGALTQKNLSNLRELKDYYTWVIFKIQ